MYCCVEYKDILHLGSKVHKASLSEKYMVQRSYTEALGEDGMAGLTHQKGHFKIGADKQHTLQKLYLSQATK